MAKNKKMLLELKKEKEIKKIMIILTCCPLLSIGQINLDLKDYIDSSPQLNYLQVRNVLKKVIFNSIKMKNWIIFIIFLSMGYTIYGQLDTSQQKIETNTIYREKLGNAIFYSINYDKILINKGIMKIAARAGLSYIPPLFFKENFGVIPIEVSALLGRSNDHLEIAGGLTFFYQFFEGYERGFFGNNIYIKRGILLFGVLRIGYRFQKPDGGIFCKVGYTPMFEIIDKLNNDKEKEILPNVFGIAVGYTFRRRDFQHKLSNHLKHQRLRNN